MEVAGGVAHSVPAWGEDGADEGEADLAAVGMPGEHQVESPAFCPGPLIWGMGEADAEGVFSAGGRGVLHVSGGAEPGEFVAGDEDLAAGDREEAPVSTDVDESGIGEGLVEAIEGTGAEVVVAEDVVGTEAGCQLAEGLGEPIDAVGFVDQVAGDDDKVWIEGICAIDEGMEVVDADAAGEVEVGEVEDGESAEGGREAFERDFEVVFAQEEGLVAGEGD